MRTVFACLFMVLPTWAWGLNLVVETRPAAAREVQVRLSLQETRDLGYLHFELTYDENRLLLLAAQPVGLLDPGRDDLLVATYPETFPDGSGSFRFSMVAPGGIDGTDRIMDLVFALVDISAGVVEVRIAATRAVDRTRVEIPVQLANDGRVAITAVGDIQGALPSISALLPPVPNPFNTGTAIPFRLAAAAAVQLRVFNLAGQEVRGFDLGVLPAGYYDSPGGAVRWDGQDSQGREAGSGVYLVYLRAGDFTQVRKALLVR